MPERYTTEDLFRELDGQNYGSYRELEQAVIGVFNQHLEDFPPHYTYRDAITWADRRGWLTPTNGGFGVTLDKAATA
jgi:hypothetical protein